MIDSNPHLAQVAAMRLVITPHLRRLGMTQSELAALVNVQKGYMSELCSGKKTCSLETLADIARALGVRAGDLIEDEPDTTPAFAFADAPATGFGENQAVPFVWQAAKKTPDPTGSLRAGLSRAETYQITVAVPWLALLPGDILLVDLGTPPADGDVILLGLTDADGFNTSTLLYRMKSGRALNLDPGATDPVLDLANDPRASWRATVRRIARLHVT